MEQIIVQVRDKEKAKILLELLAALDFVHSVKTNYAEEKTESQDEPLDFFALAGLWQDRDVSQEVIRKEAWPRQKR
jgi:hypothetical protein